MAPQFWVLRCCRCRRFQVQQAKRSGRWSCSVCGQRQTLQKVYGQGSGSDCRRHVQKLNLLQGEAEEALGWTSWCVEDSVNDSKHRAAQHGDSSDQQEGRQTSEGSRWNKYLDQESEDQQEEEEEAALERQQFCSQRKNTVGEQRKHQKSFLSKVVPEHAEDNQVFQLDYQAKKVKTTECKRCFGAVPDGDDGHDRDAVSGGRMVPAASQSVVPCAKPSKWGKFLSSSDNSNENAARVALSLQEDSGILELDSTTAVGASVARRCSEQAGRTQPQCTGSEFKKCVMSTKGVVSKVPGTVVASTSCSVDVFKEPPSQLVRAGSDVETTARRCSLDSPSRANTFANSLPGPKLSNISHEQLFCTGEEFDDDL